MKQLNLGFNKAEFSESRFRIYSFLGAGAVLLSQFLIRYVEKHANVHDPIFLLWLLAAGGLFFLAALALVTSSVGSIVLVLQSKKFKLWNLISFGGLAVLCFLLVQFLQGD